MHHLAKTILDTDKHAACGATTGQVWTAKRLREVFGWLYADQLGRLDCPDCRQIFEAQHT